MDSVLLLQNYNNKCSSHCPLLSALGSQGGLELSPPNANGAGDKWPVVASMLELPRVTKNGGTFCFIRYPLKRGNNSLLNTMLGDVQCQRHLRMLNERREAMENKLESCPHCGSTDISRYLQESSFIDSLLGFILAIIGLSSRGGMNASVEYLNSRKANWICQSCGLKFIIPER